MLYYYLKLKYGKVLFDTDDGAEVWKYLLGKLSALIAIGAGAFHFHENPIGISIYIVPLFLLLLFFRYEMIIVFKDHWIYVSGLSSPFKSYKVFHYKDLKTVISPVDYAVHEYSRKERVLNQVDPRQKVHIFFKNDTEVLFATTINRVYLQQATARINKEVERSCVPLSSR